MDDLDWLPQRPTLRPGIRVVRRDDEHLQVGIDPGHRLVLPDDLAVHDLLADLRVGRRPALDVPDVRRWCHALADRRLLVDAGELAVALAGTLPRAVVLACFAQHGSDATRRLESRARARVEVIADATWRPVALRLLSGAGVAVTSDQPTATLLVHAGGEPPRDDLDPWARDGAPHLVLRNRGGRVIVGPFVAPGLTACLRCVDAHACDEDPGHALVVEQHTAEADEPCDPLLMQLAVTWAVRDVVAYVDGDCPATWSATVTLGPAAAPDARPWTRHPRCGCAWGDVLAAG
jgi:hypothetical protein